MRHEGGCHCGGVKVTFESAQEPAALPLRACGCTFCRRHGAAWTADAAGALEFRAVEPALLARYQFGLRTSEFLLCRRCGVLVGAVCTVDGATYGAPNCNALDDRAAFTQPLRPVDYDAESADDRVGRRRKAWTPAVVRT